MSGIGIIANPHSKLNKRNPRRKALLGYILGERGHLEVTPSLEALERVAQEFHAKGIHTLAINGGDGTISQTLSACIRAYGDSPLPRIALLRGGTMNVLANNLRIRGTPEQILYRLTEAFSRDEELPTQKVQSLMVAGQIGFLFATGVAARFLKEYYKHKSNPAGAFLWIMRVWLSWFGPRTLYDRVICEDLVNLEADGRPPLSHSTCAVFCSTLKRLPFGYPLFGQVEHHPGAFQCVSFTLSAKRAVWQLPVTMIKLREGSTTGKMSFCCEDLCVSGNEPLDYTLDGELFVSQAASLKVEKGPQIDFVII